MFDTWAAYGRGKRKICGFYSDITQDPISTFISDSFTPEDEGTRMLRNGEEL